MEEISVIITCFNRERYIASSINSILCSNFKNFELIIVDDHSTDNSWEIIQDFQLKDDRIKIFRNEINIGDYKNRNYAVSLCKTNLIKFVDSDDEIYPHTLEVFYLAYLKYQSAGLFISSRYPEFQNEKFPILLTPKETFEYHFLGLGILDVGPLSAMFNKEHLLSVGSFSGKRYVGDTEVFLKMAASSQTVLVNSSIVFWRQHIDQEIKFESLVFDREIWTLKIYKEVLFSSSSPLSKKLSKKIIYHKKKEILLSIVKKSLKQKKIKTGLKVFFQVLHE